MQQPNPGTMIKIQGLSHRYLERPILENITFNALPGEIICLLGPSGSGKTTLLNLVAGLIQPGSGTLQKQSEKISYVFQEDRLLDWCTAYENLAILGGRKEEIPDWLDLVGLNGVEKMPVMRLSGGMRQRCSMARAFYHGAPLMLMDEPFKSLDYGLRLDMAKKLIQLWRRRACTILFVTHEIDEALMLADRILVLTSSPGTIAKTLQLEKRQEDRSLMDPELAAAREELLRQLLKSRLDTD